MSRRRGLRWIQSSAIPISSNSFIKPSSSSFKSFHHHHIHQDFKKKNDDDQVDNIHHDQIKFDPSQQPQRTVSRSEIEHFNQLGSTWWNESGGRSSSSSGGGFGVLHRMNPIRCRFLRERLLFDLDQDHHHHHHHHHHPHHPHPHYQFLKSKKILDVGCGGGIFSEILARLGGDVLGIDAAQDSIHAAKLHASRDPHFSIQLDPIDTQTQTQTQTNTKRDARYQLDYCHGSVESLLLVDSDQPSLHRGRYDVVCAMEVLEHVEDPWTFLSMLADLTKPGGHIILSTISRTPLSHLLTITLAESRLPLLGLVPPGTHTYSKFIKPSELTTFFRDQLGWARSYERSELESRGSIYDPLSGSWKFFPRDAFWGEWCNYFFGVKKPLS